MNRGRVGEERGSKEIDRCPLTLTGGASLVWVQSEWGVSAGIMDSLICEAVEVQASGSLKPTIEVCILQSICARFGNPVLSC
jgi:hypothetical protein